MTPTATTPTSLARILAVTGEYFNVTHDQLVSPRRMRQRFAFARQVCMYLARKRTKCSLAEIGDALGGRDHSTVLHGVRVIGRQVALNDVVGMQVRQVEERLDG